MRDLAKGEAAAERMRQEGFEAEAVHLDVTAPETGFMSGLAIDDAGTVWFSIARRIIWRHRSAVRLAISHRAVLYSQLGSDATSGNQTSIRQCLVVGQDCADYFWRRGSH